MKFIELAKSLKETLAPVYLVEGEEAYFRDHAVSGIREACALLQPSLNDMRVEGETLKGDRLVSFRDELYTLPFLDGKRLVRVYEFYPSEKEWESVLKAYAEKPCETTVLVIVNSGKRANAAELKRKGGVTYVDCSREDEETLARWLYGVTKRAGLAMDADAATLMVRYCAQDAARMKAETEKLKHLLGEGGRVTRETVERYVPKDVEYKIYELTQAASQGNYTAFCEILHDLQLKGYDENAALASLTSHYRTLSEIADMEGTDAEIARALNMKSAYPVKKNRELVDRMGAGRAREIYTRLYELSCGTKSGVYTKAGALTAAIAKIFFG